MKLWETYFELIEMIVSASLSIFYSSFLELERKCCDVKTKVFDLETSIKGSGVFLEGRTFGGVSREFPIFLSFSSLLSPTPSPVDTTDCTQFRRQPTDRLTAGVYDFVSTCSSCLWWWNATNRRRSGGSGSRRFDSRTAPSFSGHHLARYWSWIEDLGLYVNSMKGIEPICNR